MTDGDASGDAVATALSSKDNASKNQNHKNGARVVVPEHILTSDPKALLDAVDSFCSVRHDDSASASQQRRTFCPVSFLNHHFSTESLLLAHLPALRAAVQSRVAALDEAVAADVRAQSSAAGRVGRDVARARESVGALDARVGAIRDRARDSERAVLEITRDMKRLDHAKRHLQRTITALKRLHMLSQAVEALEGATNDRAYREAAHLVDAVRELSRHFASYHDTVPTMRAVRDEIELLRERLRSDVFAGFRAARGVKEKEESAGRRKTKEGKKGEGDDKVRRKKRPPLDKTDKGGAPASPSPKEDEDAPAPPPPPPAAPVLLPNSALAEACHVVDALGPDVRDALLEEFCDDQLRAYTALFLPSKKNPKPAAAPARSFKISVAVTGAASNDAAADDKERPPWSLDQVDRRYAWFRRTLREFDQRFEEVFPVYWQVHHRLTKRFLSTTRTHLTSLLGDGSGGDNDEERKRAEPLDKDARDATVLLKALQKTILFEKEMTAWHARDFGTVFEDKAPAVAADQHLDENAPLEFDEEGNAVTADSARGIRIKYQRQLRERARNPTTTTTTTSTTASVRRDPHAHDPVPPFLAAASSAFDDHMTPYIDLERENMNDALAAAASDDRVDARGDGLPVFTSSTNLFVYIRNSIARCTALASDRTLRALAEAFEDALARYADEVLARKLPTAGGGATGALGGFSASTAVDAPYRLADGDEIAACHVVDTCEYCADTVEALEESLRGRFVDPVHRDAVDLGPAAERFRETAAVGLRALASGLRHRARASLDMRAIDWGTLETVGEESPYVAAVGAVVTPFFAAVGPLLPSSYLRPLADRAAANLAADLYDAVVRCKKISESGTQQLLLDAYSLRTLCQTTTPNAAADVRGFSRVETLLKLVATPTESLVDVFRSTWPDGTRTDFTNVLSLKGMKRAEQTIWLEKSGLTKEGGDDSSKAGGGGGSVGAVVGASLAAGSVAVTELWNKGKSGAAAGVNTADGLADKVNSDLTQMRQKVDDFRKQFR